MKSRRLKLLEKAYDAVYDVDLNFKFNEVLKELQIEALSLGYEFRLNKSDKFRLYKIKD